MDPYILIVENEPDIADIVRRYLEFEGFRAVCATSCEAGRDLVGARLPDLIVLDWKLPDVDGDVWVTELRSDPVTAGIPVILMTGGYPTTALTVQMASAHIPILIKPFSLDHLMDHMARLLNRERMVGAG